jgi:hypothetical protein
MPTCSKTNNSGHVLWPRANAREREHRRKWWARGHEPCTLHVSLWMGPSIPTAATPSYPAVSFSVCTQAVDLPVY